ncbi:MAG: BMP family ABC transporter substrate-binding protein [Nitriliruptorales bacterium]|nr:BMP family ABC transporter substrate-binding protein [Nitriliruptorales bacterium]
MMRTYLRVLTPLFALALLATACGGNGDTTDTETQTEPATGTETEAETAGETETETEAQAGGGEGTRVGLVFDIGGRGDQSFNDAAYAGLEQAQTELGVETKFLEPEGGGENREELLRLLAEDGFPLIFAVGFLFSDSVAAVAPNFPDSTFGLIDSVVEEPNVASLVFAEEQGSFLVGAIAALESETGKIGFIGGVETDLIKKFEAGYVAGAQHINPDIEVDVKYITQPPDFSGFNDPAKGKEIALSQYNAGADVIYHAAGGSGSGLFDAAKEVSEQGDTKVWAIGVDSDQYQTADPSVQEYILTSMLKRVDVAVFETTQSFVNGEDVGGVRVFDLSVDGVGYSQSGGFVDEYVDQVDDLKQQIIDGEIEVPTTPEG